MSKNVSKIQKAQKRRFIYFFSFAVGIIILATLGILLAASYILFYFKVVDLTTSPYAGIIYVVIFLISSIIIGVCISFLANKFVLNPINKLIEGMNNLSEGKFNTRIDMGRYVEMKQLSESFNNLAKEMENNEMLHYDFINNFSHEFKTPIASINGLITLLKNKKLPENKKIQYLNIIEEEAERLISMTSNILNLSKVENKSILKDVENYNLSEQIRNCILLLEKKWSRKHLSLSLDFDEYYIDANIDMMKQVLVNLLDNAIKFADDKTELKVAIEENNKETILSIDNIGVEISEENRSKIFNKFYQVDSTHTKEGNGIGLSIVKHIIDLHRGSIKVNCENGHTIFTISIPKKI